MILVEPAYTRSLYFDHRQKTNTHVQAYATERLRYTAGFGGVILKVGYNLLPTTACVAPSVLTSVELVPDFP